MKNKLPFAAALLVPVFAYGANPTADLSVQIVPAVSGALPGSILPPGKWMIAFDDEFNGSSVNYSNWNATPADGANLNGSTQYCSQMATVSNGVLTISDYGTIPVPQPGSYTCYLNRPNMGPGYYEARVQFSPAGWQDFWLCCNGQNGADYFEPDIAEASSPNSAWVGALHYNSGSTAFGPRESFTGFHVWGFDWEADSGYTFYVDGVAGLQGNYNNCSAATPCNTPTTLFLSNGLYHTNQPQTGFQVDWVRVYTHS